MAGFFILEKEGGATCKEWTISGHVLLPQEEVGCPYQVDDLTTADQEIPFHWLKVTFLGEADTAITLGIKCWLCWFVDLGLSTSDSIWVSFF